MGFFDDAEKFLADRQNHAAPSEDDNILLLDTPAQHEQLFNKLRRLYENATRLEIERAIDTVQSEMDKPYDKRVFMKKIRVKLED